MIPGIDLDEMLYKFLISFAIGIVMLIVFLGLSQKYFDKPKIPYELLEWTDGSGCTACIYIDGQSYYGSNIENVVGTDKYIVYRENDYLVLPDKIIVREID